MGLVIECQGVVSGAGIRGVSALPFPAKLMAGAMIPRWHKAELMVQALRTGDAGLILLSLLNDHGTQTLAQAEVLLEAWFADPRNKRLAQHLRAVRVCEAEMAFLSSLTVGSKM